MGDNKIFGTNLRYYLQLRNITQKELAEHLGISKQAVSLWCSGSGNPRMSKIEDICSYLNITRAQLLLSKEDAEYEDTRIELDSIIEEMNTEQLKTLLGMAQVLIQNKGV